MCATTGTGEVAGAKEVRWVSAKRRNDTHKRAAAAGLTGYDTVAAARKDVNVVCSGWPPHAASEVATTGAKCGYRGLFVDGNAVSPESARKTSALVSAAGAPFVHGGIIGPPAHNPGSTRLYLSGAEAAAVVDAFQGSALQAIAMDTRPGAASALQMCYAAWTKGSAALLTGVRALALAEGVEEALLEEWAISQQGLDARSDRRGPQQRLQSRASGRRDARDRHHLRGIRASRWMPPCRHRHL